MTPLDRLTPSHVALLGAIVENPGISAQHLALRLPPASISAWATTFQDLLILGLVREHRRRRRAFVPTQAGVNLCQGLVVQTEWRIAG